MHNLEDEIAKLCLDKYASLKKTGKPSNCEWTVLSGIVLQNSSKELCVLSLCTGTKCLSGVELRSTKCNERGNKLSDSHAEILARRAFLRYLYHQIELAISNQKSDIFYLEDNGIKLRDVSFHFFSSQTPCGDCSIIPKLTGETEDLVCPPKKARTEDESLASQFGQAIVDIYRTGAKCVDSDERQDPHEKGINYHTVGPLRTKPGRGDRTLSLSCSDKLAKWNVMGVQGALLSLMIPTIKFESIVIGGGCPYSLESMQRGIFQRFDPNIGAPEIVQSQISFEHRKNESRTRPCPSSIVWCLVPEKPIEIAVDGLRQGATKKKNKSFNLLISRKEIFKTFLTIYDKFLKGKLIPQHPKKITYYHCKQYSSSYQNLWREKSAVFSKWPTKPLYLQELLVF
ncbi:tRNA-specific adenosine deaminase 1 isoform X1 [Nasonia vitripennis]|uniref:tRNA-specific adenosine deaminase 1 n=1 Tax=Nasonia vitripennis TaxID=7425 RepID=A0A7M7H2U8_NASVI|nr:tRNA-specific adenosine deaminase 1 isoform X1 [Nasonia vitripennis]